MSESIPDTARDLFEKPNFAHIVTLMRDGMPQVTPVWIDIEPGSNVIIFNTADGRLKQKNLDRDSRVALSVADNENPYRYVQVRGRVIEKTYEGADAHIDQLAKKYMGLDSYPYRTETEKRVIYRIEPEAVQTYG
ncbi:MAG: PPOX class F420-dependent oxidoreductase [Dehalococcoidia bacterium]|nr:PPOX class F420-dependent oxidoreductase [Dehalococcoidia bacterium]